MRIKQWIEQCVPAQGNDETSNIPKIKDYWRAEELQSPSNVVTALSSLPPRYVANFLVQTFFKHAETNYFYVERGWLLEKLDLAYGDAGSFSRRDVGSLCMLFIVFAIGTQYAYLESRDGNTQSHNDAGLQGSGSGSAAGQKQGPFSEDAIGVMFYQQACQLVPDVVTIASLECVQACLLIGLYALPLDASGLSYTYLNLAIKLAILNGMHRKSPEGVLDPITRETRNRVWWTAYTTEKRIGIFHGRPVSISSNEIDVEMPVDRPDLWPSNPPSHYPRMFATLQLNQALAIISQEITILRTYPKAEISDRLGKLVDLKMKLDAWWQGLPEVVKPSEPDDPPSQISRSAMHLKLEYCLVRMFAGRPFLFPKEFVGKGSTGSPESVTGGGGGGGSSPSVEATRPRTQSQAGVASLGSSGGLKPSASTPTHASTGTNPRSVLVTDCVDAALTVIDTCAQLRNTVGLARASYTEFSSCRAALLVIITQCLLQQQRRGQQQRAATSVNSASSVSGASTVVGGSGAGAGVASSRATMATPDSQRRMREALRQGMAMLKEMAAGGESATSEASLIEAFERAIARLDDDIAVAEGAEEVSSAPDYSSFKKWETLWKSGGVGGGIAPAASVAGTSVSGTVPTMMMDYQHQHHGDPGNASRSISSIMAGAGISGNAHHHSMMPPVPLPPEPPEFSDNQEHAHNRHPAPSYVHAATDAGQQHQQQDMASMEVLMTTPFFGVDTHLQWLSQPVEEGSTSIFGYGFGTGMDSTSGTGGGGGNTWTGL
ncbi:fungal-specific transcription factor domain-containing protein [Xylariales sp. PMI_506]|nr:fungal-specific transcription factor domain-containing protein [Xylariales sp. PMI_506]